jgi:hypothetical protein
MDFETQQLRIKYDGILRIHVLPSCRWCSIFWMLTSFTNCHEVASYCRFCAGSYSEEAWNATNRVGKRQTCLASSEVNCGISEYGTKMTRINLQSVGATGAIITRQFDGYTDLAFAKPRARFPTIRYDTRTGSHIRSGVIEAESSQSAQ